MSNIKPSAASDLNISDVIEVIEHDPEYFEPPKQAVAPVSLLSTAMASAATSDGLVMLNPSSAAVDSDTEAKRRASVKILEQPASKALRFRYECEGRSAGSIPGANSSSDTKTYPTIQVIGYRGRAVVVVSCVTKDPPYRPHPHSLVGKEGCKKGVCTIEINNDNMICTFSNLGIQCVKKRGIEDALKQREEIRVDPFHTGFSHRSQPQSIDLNAVRLCFQVFLEGAQKGKFTFPLKPVVSDPIYDKKAMCDLTICKLSDFTSPVTGGKEIILLCDKVTKDDIQIRFYEERDGHIFWEGLGDFQSSDVHKQVAISFRTPRYRTVEVEDPIQTYIQLRRPSDGAISEPRPFQYLPTDSGSRVAGKMGSIPVIVSKKSKPDFQLYSHILAADAAYLSSHLFQVGGNFPIHDDNPNVPSCDISKEMHVDDVLLPEDHKGNASKEYDISKSSDKVVCESNIMAPALGGSHVLVVHGNEHLPSVSDNSCDERNIMNESKSDVQLYPNKKDHFVVVSNPHQPVMMSMLDSESDVRYSIASSEDLNSRLSAAFSDYSDVTDVNSIYSDTLSVASSSRTLNDRLSQTLDNGVSDSDLTVIDQDNDSDTLSVSTIEKQLEILQSMSVDQDTQLYSSFQMAMKNPVGNWPVGSKKLISSHQREMHIDTSDKLYDDPLEDLSETLEDHEENFKSNRDVLLPAVPPRIESMGQQTPPLPPRRFKKQNQPLPDPPSRDLGIKTALQAIKQTFKKSKTGTKVVETCTANKVNQDDNSPSQILNSSQENVSDKGDESLPNRDKIECSGQSPQLSISKSASKEKISTSSSVKANSNDCNTVHSVESFPVSERGSIIGNDGDSSDHLTEVENYALYMRIAPLATASEFDDSETLSMLYAELTDADILKRKRLRLSDANSSRLVAYIRDNSLESGLTNSIHAEPVKSNVGGGASSRPVIQGVRSKVKREPSDVASPEPGDISINTGFGYDTQPAGLSPNVSYAPRFQINPSTPYSLNASPHYQPISPNPPLQNYGYNFPLSSSANYNIPVLTSPMNIAGDKVKSNQFGATSIMDLDNLNIEQQPEIDLSDLPPVNLPLNESNIGLIGSHLLENLSLQEIDVNFKANSSSSSNVFKSDMKSSTTKSKTVTSDGTGLSGMNFSASDLPELTLSGMLSSADLDSADGFARITSSSVINDLDVLNALSKQNNQ